ncbi:Mex67p [Saccharomyces eubayanus]|uniref:Mex67p n=1 Tax=Saccharomyces eubayanus TaxID=1080349 RepID=UPI0006C68010|nr:MEX67-like protein [Saccharomyces eubayanus]KOG96149.1 MEX67-like protein [Saccharomyces eubayanus]
MSGFHNVGNINMMAQQQLQQNRVKVSIRNWQNATMNDLINFISRNARVAVLDAHVDGPLVVGFVNSKAEAESLMKWNGVRFAGSNLKFELLDGNGGSAGTSDTISFLRGVLLKRYDPQSKLLNLGALHSDPELIQKGVFSSISTQSKMFPAMMKLASTEPSLVVESVNLADNQLKDISAISTLAQSFPNLKNLCLANNQIFRFRSLEVWKNKFKDLRELLMTNNPITTDKLYRTEMLRLFPKLVVLDNVIVRDEQKLHSVYSLPMKIQQFFFENDALGQSSTDFATNFLNLWDNNREQLLNLYSPQSQFSVSVDSTIPPSTVADSDQTPSFGYYMPCSRNISKVSSEKSIQQRLSIGQESINNIFKTLPRTKHHLQDQPNEYSMETISYPQINGFIITLHGFFEETGKPEMEANKKTGKNNYQKNRRYNHGYNSTSNNKLFKKSFDRTWVIVPMNNSVIIASDLLTVRAYSAGAWKTASVDVPASLPLQQPSVLPQAAIPPNASMNPNITTPPPPQPSVVPGGMNMPGVPQGPMVMAPTLQLPPDVQSRLNPVQLELLNKLHLQTKLNAEYTFMLAEQSNWNYEVAIKGFQGSMNGIPREAFVQF